MKHRLTFLLTAFLLLTGLSLRAQTPTLTVSTTSISGLTYDLEEGGPSEITSFEIGGQYLTTPFTVYVHPSESFEVSTSGGELFHAENPAAIYSSVDEFSGVNVYVRLKADLELGTYNEQIFATSDGADTIYISVSGTVTNDGPTPPPTPGDGNYVRISNLSSLTAGSFVVFAARFDDNDSNYYAMRNATSGKPTGVLFISDANEDNEILPASIADQENNFYWIVGVTENGFTFTNASGDTIGHTASTNFATNGNNTEWAITFQTAGAGAMVPNYSGFVINNVNNSERAFALNNNHNFGPYSFTNNSNNSGYNFYLDLFVKAEGGVPPTPTVATPTFTPAAGSYYSPQEVHIECATEGATIHYTLDGTDPTETSPEYSAPILVDTTTTIKAIAMKEDYNNSGIAVATYTILQSGEASFNQDWETDWHGWTRVSVAGETAEWTIAEHSNNHYAYMNAFQQGANEDWLISPAFDLDDYSNPILSFRTAKNFTGNNLEVYFSNDYDGVDPTTATWTALTCNLSTGGFAWTESGAIDLSSFSGTDCYIGFKYTSTETSAAAWEVDDIVLASQTTDPVVTVTPLTLSGFSYIEGNGPSSEQSLTISGINLSHNITIEEGTNYEISLDPGDDFEAQSSLTLTPVGGNLAETTIYVRLRAGLAIGEYNEDIITITCADVDDIEITCSGSVIEEPVPGGDYVRITNASELLAGNQVILAVRYNATANAYRAIANTLTGGKPATTEFTSTTNGANEVVPASIMAEEDNYYWTVDVTTDGYTFTNANGDMIGYGNNGTNFVMNGTKTVWAIEGGTSGENALVPSYSGFNITNTTNTDRAFAIRFNNSAYSCGAYSMNNAGGAQANQYNFYLDIFMQGEAGTPTVATPTFSPATGTYYEPQEVTITCPTAGATVYYSLTSASGPWTQYTTPIDVDENMTIWAYAKKEGFNDSSIATATYIIQVGVVTIFNQDWEDGWHGWTQVNVEGETAEWTIGEHSGNHYAYMNAYLQGTNEDWLISPAINLNTIGNPVLSFRTAKSFMGNDLNVYISNDYDGEDPTEATWTALTCTLSSGGYTWTESGNMDLSSFSGTECYIGFKYTCEMLSAAAWEIDDIMLVGQTSGPIVTVSPLTLNDFTYVVGNGPSDEQSFTVSGFNLTSNITIEQGSKYEISLASGEGFHPQNTITLTPVGGVVAGTSILVRLKAGLAVGEYNEDNISITCADVDDIEVSCNGNVTAQPVPGGNYVRISDLSELVSGNQVILAARYNETANAYRAIANTLTGNKLGTTEFTSQINGTDEIVSADIMAEEDNYYWTVNVTTEGYTFTNANGDIIGYGNSTNFNMNGEKTDWTIEAATSGENTLVPNYSGFNIVNVATDTRAFAIRFNNDAYTCGAYSTSNMSGPQAGQYNFCLDIFMQGEGGTPTVAAPTFSPAPGTYFEPQEVTISCTTEGATIYYSLTSESGPWSEYTAPITIEETTTIWAYAKKEGYNISPFVHAEYIIQGDLVIIFNQDWEDDWHGWTQVNVEGETAEWTIGEHSSNHYAYMNAYQQGANEDWLISPAFDLDSYSDAMLSFRTARNFNGPDIVVYFSNDYDGEDPTAATWTTLTYHLSAGGYAWTESGDISLSAFSGRECYIAFKYTSTEENAAAWEIDDIMLTAGGSTNPNITATPNIINGLNYPVDQGPSHPQIYTLTAANLEGEGIVVVTASENFEISVDGEVFREAFEIAYAHGQFEDQPVTIYVRLAEDLEIGAYEGTITHQGGGASVDVQVAGAVLGEDEPTMSAFMSLYIQGNNGSNNNRIPTATPVQFINLEPNATYRYTNQFVDSNDSPETAGAGNVIYANASGFYRSTNPSLAAEGGYGEFTTDELGRATVWVLNEPTANARFTPGNQVYLRIRTNDGHDGTAVSHVFTSEDYSTVLNFGTENDEFSGSAFYAKSNEAQMSFAMLFTDYDADRPAYTTSIETTGIDYENINQYADFYKEEVSNKDGWFGGILPNHNDKGITYIVTISMDLQTIHEYESEDGQWYPEANTIEPTNGLDNPIFIDLTYDGVAESAEANLKVWSADHEFVVENSDDAHYMMTVYNILGQPMIKKQVNAGSTERISHSLATGFYIINLQNNQNMVSIKVIVR